jgi:hypothetical protein
VTSADVLYVISALCIALGFIALLSQRLYIDAKTHQATAVKLPFFGKLKTNYPALIFVFIGGALAFEAVRNSPQKEQWTLTGTLTNPPGKDVKWVEGTFTLVPRAVLSQIGDEGGFEIDVQIDKGKSIEQIYHTLDYSVNEGNVQIDLLKEYQASKNGQDSLIEHITGHNVKFKSIAIQARDRPPPQ